MTGEMSIMSHKGDVKVIWDSEKEAEVAAAKAQFEALVGKGYAAFKVKKDGSEGEQVRKFDPELEKMILIPALQGG